MNRLIVVVLSGMFLSPAFADGMYETVSASRIIDVNSVSIPAEFNYSPLYRQVTGDFNRSIDRIDGARVVNTNTRFTYTPLYLKVTGKII